MKPGRHTQRSAATALAGVAIVSFAAGCAAGPDLSVVRSDGMILLVNNDVRAGMDAQVRGTVALTGSGCVAVDAGDGAELVPVLWPRGTTLDAATVVLPGGDRLDIGDALDGGGGYTAPGEPWEADVPPECAPTDGVFVRLTSAGRG